MPPKITVNYEEHEDQLLPIHMIINFGRGKIQWDKSFYIPLEAPFNQQRTEDYYDEIMSVTITQSDMILDPERPTHFGIYFPFVVVPHSENNKGRSKELSSVRRE